MAVMDVMMRGGASFFGTRTIPIRIISTRNRKFVEYNQMSKLSI